MIPVLRDIPQLNDLGRPWKFRQVYTFIYFYFSCLSLVFLLSVVALEFSVQPSFSLLYAILYYLEYEAW